MRNASVMSLYVWTCVCLEETPGYVSQWERGAVKVSMETMTAKKDSSSAETVLQQAAARE